MKAELHNEILRLLKLEKALSTGEMNWEATLNHTKEKIRFLEHIYRSEVGNGFHFSECFRSSAIAERNNLCLTSSAIEWIIRDEKEHKEKADQNLKAITT